MKGYIHSFESFGTKDGPGIRFVFFMQGCPLRCLYCHNVDTWNLKDRNKELDPEQAFNEIYKVRNFIKTGGVTVSGGEPLTQPDFIKELFIKCREANIPTCIDTSGYIFTNRVKEVLEYTDLVLLDIKHIDPEKYKKLTSVSLEPTLKFAKYLQEINKPVWLRYVLVPGYTDAPEDLHKWAEFCSQFTNVQRVDILPFHQMGTPKWEMMKREYLLKNNREANGDDVEKAENIFLEYGLPVKVTSR